MAVATYSGIAELARMMATGWRLIFYNQISWVFTKIRVYSTPDNKNPPFRLDEPSANVGEQNITDFAMTSTLGRITFTGQLTVGDGNTLRWLILLYSAVAFQAGTGFFNLNNIKFFNARLPNYVKVADNDPNLIININIRRQ